MADAVAVVMHKRQEGWAHGSSLAIICQVACNAHRPLSIAKLVVAYHRCACNHDITRLRLRALNTMTSKLRSAIRS